MTKNVLVVGSGGREHAIAWKLAQSDLVAKVFVAPGNGGTATAGGKLTNVPIAESHIDELIEFAGSNAVDLTVIGPEAPLVAGIVDCFEDAGLACFGPVSGAARLEGSKRFAKQVMDKVDVPSAEYQIFTDYEEALSHIRTAEHPLVLKASGLAAGKGVIVAGSLAEAEQGLKRLMIDREFGDAADEVIVEEYLEGQEATILAFCDGTTIVPMPAAQDHKPLLDGDHGPNTGGMGAYAPTPVVDDTVNRFVIESIIRPVVRQLAIEGYPYVGVIYAGLMLTDDGPKVLDFNCRFGDPEAQVVLPLLESDLYEILVACVDGHLDSVDVAWNDGVAATVVAASDGYPGSCDTGLPITGIAEAESVPGVTVFHAGTAMDEGLVTSGGRVLTVTGVQPDLSMALACAYHGIEHLDFEGMVFRNDIGARIAGQIDTGGSPVSLPWQSTHGNDAANGNAGERAVEMMERDVRSTYGADVIAGIGAFGGMFDAAGLGDDPILVASTDGVGAKTKIATAMGRYDMLGHDIVNHCINDILVQGARPLFFLDYIATSALDPLVAATVVGGMANACRLAGCALLGGETAEIPGVYLDDEIDVVGTIVGVVERARIIDPATAAAGDVVLALTSTGLHTNGYSRARQVFEHWDLTDRVAALGTSLGHALLEPHRSYLPEITRLREAGVGIRALVHITGGGLMESPARVLPESLAMSLDLGSWKVPPLFALVRSQGNVDEEEMFRTFNMGVGMLVVVPANRVQDALSTLGPDAWAIGEVVPRAVDPVVLS